MSSSSGAVHVYLTRLNIIGSSYATRLAYLSSLLEVTVVNVNEDVQSSEAVVIIRVDIEPQLLAIGPYHVVVAMNNRCWFYAFANEQILLKEKEYLAIIKSIQLNHDYVALLFTDGKCLLHLIESNNSNNNDVDDEDDDENARKEMKLFECDTKITCIKLNNQLFIYATESGSIEFFLLEDWTMVNVYRHQHAIKAIECDANGLRLIIIDERNDCFVYNAISDQLLSIESIESSSIRKIIWDQFDKSIFILMDAKFIYIYSYLNDSIDGECCSFVGKDKLVSGQYPLLLYNGVVVCQTDSGKTSNFILTTHELNETKNEEKLFQDLLKLRKFQDAYKLCLILNKNELWHQLAEYAMQTFQLDVAIKVYKHLNEIGYIKSLQHLKASCEERNLFAAHIAMYLNRFDHAQQLFLASSQPLQALNMRQSIHDWNEALILAKRLSPDQISIISREYANQLEFIGDYQQSLYHYEQALINVDEASANLNEIDLRTKHHNELCEAGIARNSLRTGNVRKGIEYAMKYEHSNQQLFIECAAILEQQKLYSDAALMYEHGKQYNKAIELYLLLKQMQKVEQLIGKINLLENKELITTYAKYKEQSKQYKDAIELYKSINDEHNAVKLLLDKMNSPNEAIQIYRQNKNEHVAKMIARFFQRINDITSAIEFLCLSRCNDEAFKLASQTGQMDIYANILLHNNKSNNNSNNNSNNSGDNNNAAVVVVDVVNYSDDYNSIAIYYEQEKNQLMAGKFNCLNEKTMRKGVKQLVSASQLKYKNCGEVDADAVNTAINALSKHREEQSIKYLINYLLGELDGHPKDFKYLFRLYMKLGEYKDAAKTSLIIAAEQQNIGQYKNSHQLLFQMCKELKQQQIAIPVDMLQYLQLIHSYLLIKVWCKLNDSMKSAQLLIRCCSNLSKFPLHSCELLTTAVIQCLKAGFKSYAYQYAKQLIQMDQYQSKVDSNHVIINASKIADKVFAALRSDFGG
ncbi:hypothetical protein B4U80_10810 [Leptotrombidium deliense]|uniref:WD repeat-containing protein 19-like protein n=1 Tax=Leptotrombidium deliense TaxID=299467 RepID=A0A443SWI2_9ACAR|nr:hypothetical protein B4U80_10810 [Leptotrombidium deliense]